MYQNDFRYSTHVRDLAAPIFFGHRKNFFFFKSRNELLLYVGIGIRFMPEGDPDCKFIFWTISFQILDTLGLRRLYMYMYVSRLYAREGFYYTRAPPLHPATLLAGAKN